MGASDPYVIDDELGTPDYTGAYETAGNGFDDSGHSCEWNGMPVRCQLLSFVARTQDVDVSKTGVRYQGNEAPGFAAGFDVREVWGEKATVREGSSQVTGAEDASLTLPEYEVDVVATFMGYEVVGVPQNRQNRQPRTMEQARRDLHTAVRDALRVLSEKEDCRNLFGAQVDPVQLLTDLYTGQHDVGTLDFGDLGAPSDGRVTSASTVLKTRGSALIQGSRGTYRRSLNAGAYITINSNAAAPFRSGYGDYLGVGAGDEVYRAMTIIHELGHAARRLYGNSGSLIDEDHNVPDASSINRANSRRVYDNCFR